MKVLITGGAGAIGSNVVDTLLARSDEVGVLDSFHEFYPRARKERNLEAARSSPGFAGLWEGDVRDADLVSRCMRELRPDAVIHLAARAGVFPSLDAPEEYIDCNVTGTAVVVRNAIEAGVGRLLLASSSSVYGVRPRERFREDAPADRPISPYGASKRAAEMLCHAMHDMSGLPITCLRFFNAYGPRQRPDLVIYRFAQLALQNKPIPVYGDGSVERDYTFINDVVDGILRALDRADGYHIYNLGRGQPVTVNDMITALENALGTTIERDPLPPRAGDVPRTWASIDLARDELGYDPRVELPEGIEAFLDWLRREDA